ncbi:MAG TPA: PDZ domain-containing protein [Vicinamibacteria bacterium]|nr:PDZ domain-containing protein [Vicinamibacteria bacterium]
MSPVLAVLMLSAVPADLSAIGIVLSRDPARSVVLLRAGERTRAASVGETAFGGRVTAIAPGVVTVEFEGERMELRLSAGGGPAGPPPRAAAPATSDPGARVLERREVERRLGEEASRILAETSLVPALDGGHVAGFTLTRVPEGSLLTDAGLRAGDVLTSVNDTPINSMATLVALWPRLQNETTLRAVVLRNGQPVALTVNLR